VSGLVSGLDVLAQIGHFTAQLSELVHQVFLDLTVFGFDFFFHKDGRQRGRDQLQHGQAQQHHDH